MARLICDRSTKAANRKWVEPINSKSIFVKNPTNHFIKLETTPVCYLFEACFF